MASRNRSLPSNVRNFGATPPVQLSRSTFNLSKTWKGTFDAGELVPFYLSEGLPGDTRKVRMSSIIRLATPLKPFMDNLVVDFHFWWCPNRQLWTNWVKFMGEQENPGDSIDYLIPTTTIDEGMAEGAKRLFDYMGVPVGNLESGVATDINVLPMRMYNRVYNFHYRDQNLIPSVPFSDDDGPDVRNEYRIQRRGKRHDYLTASLPFQQKGQPVDLPLGGTAPVIPDTTIPNITDRPFFQDFGEAGSGSIEEGVAQNLALDTNIGPQNTPLKWLGSGLVADLATGTAATITDLRQAIAIQHVLERDARSGTRYPEILLSRFRVFDPQMLVLQRPEYLGGGTRPINVSPVASTVPTPDDPTADNVQGNLAAVGVSMIDGIGFTRSFTEHGYIMGIMSARADLTYQQGLEKLWNRRSRFDFYHPELAHLSEQAVASKEIYMDGTEDDDSVWGYIGAYDEYRYGVSLITSRFRSTDPTPLDVWHLSQYFTNRPTLNQTFIEENPPVDRVIAVQDEPHFLADIWINDVAARPLPITGIPGLSRI